MPHPKKKTTRGTGGQRRSHDHLTAVTASVCPKCQEPKISHQVCSKCGFYKDNKVINTDKAAERVLRKSTATTEVVEEKPAKEEKKAEKKTKKSTAKKVEKKTEEKVEKKEENKEEKTSE
jgi:large subunit ribosomal protein L32